MRIILPLAAALLAAGCAAQQQPAVKPGAEAIRRLEDTVEESDEAPLARPAGASRNPGAPVSPRDGGASPA